MTAAIGDMLSTALANTQKFVVLADQAALGGTGVLVSGSVKSFEPEAGGGGGLGGLRRRALGAVGVEEKSAELELELRLIDNRNGRVLKSKSLEAKSTNWDADVSGGN
jgi:curli biogenesis system outer membrane secretion channel CsgG